MPAIKPDRVLGDLYKLRTFGTYKTGVHRPTLSPDDIAARNWFAEQCTAAGPRDHHRRHRQYFRKEQGDRREGAVRLAPGKPEPCRLARRAARLRLRARGLARDRGGGRRRRRRRRGVLRRGGPFRLVPRIEVVHRPAQGRGRRQGAQPPRRHADARGAGQGRLRRAAARDHRAGALQGVLRGAYRAGRHARDREAAHRRGHGDRGDLAIFASR